MVLVCNEINKIHRKEVGCIIFNHQDFRSGGAPIKLYALEKWYQIATEGDRYIFFNYGPL